MTKAAYHPIADEAAQAFTSCVDALVMRNLSVPNLSATGTTLTDSGVLEGLTGGKERQSGVERSK